MHPLTQDLSKLSDAELEKKVGDLCRRYTQATRIGPAGIIHQIQMMLDDYQTELRRRRELQLEQLLKNNKNFKDIIDIS